MAKKKENKTFSTGRSINKNTVPSDWKIRISNFLKEAEWDKENKCYFAYCNKLKQKRYGPGQSYGKPNPQYYPPKSIINEEKYNRLNVWTIYQDDINLGMHFFKKNYQVGYIEKLTGLDIDDIMKKIKKSKNFSDIDYLKIRANTALFTLDNSEFQSFDENTIHIWINLFSSLERVFNTKLSKLNVIKWTVTKDKSDIENYLLDWEISLIPKIEQNLIKKDKSIDNIYKTVKFIRDLSAHYDYYTKSPNEATYYILVSTYIKQDFIYLLCVKISNENKNLILLQYSISNLKEITEVFVKNIFENHSSNTSEKLVILDSKYIKES